MSSKWQYRRRPGASWQYIVTNTQDLPDPGYHWFGVAVKFDGPTEEGELDEQYGPPDGSIDGDGRGEDRLMDLTN